jgi:hypothetical protein
MKTISIKAAARAEAARGAEETRAAKALRVMRETIKAKEVKANRPSPELCSHHWQVFGFADEENRLMAECARCGLDGSIDNPTSEEKSHRRPFAIDAGRVTEHPESISPRTHWRQASREWWSRIFPAEAETAV